MKGYLIMRSKIDLNRQEHRRLVDRLRRALPVAAYPRQRLLAFLIARGVVVHGKPRLLVIDVFDAGNAFGLMCRFSLRNGDGGRDLVAPLGQIALDQKHPAARALARLG
jgi:hypothetical protein